MIKDIKLYFVPAFIYVPPTMIQHQFGKLNVFDHSGNANFIIFDTALEKFLQRSCAELVGSNGMVIT